MPTFQLDTQFTDTDLQRFLASGSNVVVAKPSDGGDPNVAWLVYRPLINNTITWEEQYGIYASNAEIQNGAQLNQISQTEFPAQDGRRYTMGASGAFGSSQPGGTPNAYTATNEYNNLPRGLLTFGLFQNANVNGDDAVGNAVSAAAVPFNSTAVMTPFTTVYLWIQSQVKSNTVVTTVTSPMTKATFGGSTPQISLKYDAQTGTFVPTSSKVSKKEIGLEHRMPLLA